jgi:hypothetical protein
VDRFLYALTRHRPDGRVNLGQRKGVGSKFMQRVLPGSNLLQRQFYCRIAMPTRTLHRNIFARQLAEREVRKMRDIISLKYNCCPFALTARGLCQRVRSHPRPHQLPRQP